MDDEKLIECVRKYEFLYNVLHPKYMDTAKKEIAWKNISLQLKQPARACKQRWQGLRDSYRRALKKKREKSGESTKKMKKWRYEAEMAFVAPFFSEKKPQDSIDATATSDDEDPDNDHETHENDSSDKAYFDRRVNDVTLDDGNNGIGRIELDAVQNYPQYFHKKAKKSEIHTASAVLMARLLDHQNKPEPELDQLDRFFLTISETVKKFPPYLQAVVKNKVFTLVSEMELQRLAPPNLTPSSSHGP